MIQRLNAALTPLDAALAALLDGVVPVVPKERPLSGAIGHIAAGGPSIAHALPAYNIAVVDGWAFRANDLVGASSYSPLLLRHSPAWVEAGEPLPADCDCVVEAGLVQQLGSMFQVLAEAIPGLGVRRAGDDMAAGVPLIAAGVRISPAHIMAARAAGLGALEVRAARLRVVNVPPAKNDSTSSQFIASLAMAEGADVDFSIAAARDAVSIADSMDTNACDLIVLLGGTGAGQTDATVEALAARGKVLAHGLALQPCRTCAIGRIGTTPVIALPGAPDQALAGWLTLVQPVLDRLSARIPRQMTFRALARKISSAIGVTEIVLLKRLNEDWMPLAVGALSLDAVVNADAWIAVPGDREGYAAGTSVGAFSLFKVS